MLGNGQAIAVWDTADKKVVLLFTSAKYAEQVLFGADKGSIPNWIVSGKKKVIDLRNEEAKKKEPKDGEELIRTIFFRMAKSEHSKLLSTLAPHEKGIILDRRFVLPAKMRKMYELL